ncbi:hypothetical protein IBX73_11250, partial [candidate division WOR-3 bacterium]|nr:hypothetical protein [candidate division WOR-3 bacterium]
DTLLFLAGYDRGLLIYSVKMPEQPILLARYRTSDPIWDVVVQDTLAFCVGSYEMTIFNVADPENPWVVSVWLAPWPFLLRLDVMDDYVYITMRRSWPSTAMGIYIVDVSDPVHPILTGQLLTLPMSTAIVISDGFAYLYSGSVVDVADPENPTLIAQVYYGFREMCLDGDLLYCSGPKIMDISDPYSPFLLGHGYQGAAGYLAKIGNFLYGAWNGVNVYDVSEPQLPFQVGEFRLSTSLKTRVMAANNLAVVSECYPPGISIIDIADPGNCLVLDSYEFLHESDNSWSPQIALQGDYLYATAKDSGLRVLDISDPTNITEIGHCPIPGSSPNSPALVMNIAVQGEYAFLGCRRSAYPLAIVNVADPANPFLVSGIPNSTSFNYVLDLSVNGAYVYCGANSGLKVVDVSNPYDPVYIAQCSLSTYCEPICASGDYVYLGDSPNGTLWIIYVANPYNPFVVGQCPELSVSDISIYGNYVFLAETQGLRILDVTEPANWQEVGYYRTPYMDCYGVDAEGGSVYLATQQGMWILQFYGMAVAERTVKSNQARIRISTVGRRIRYTYSLQHDSRVKTSLIDICGRVVRRIVADESAGTHTQEIAGTDIPSGIYFLRLETEEYCALEKVVLLK